MAITKTGEQTLAVRFRPQPLEDVVMNGRSLSIRVLLLTLFLVGARVRAETPVTGAQALERLKAGNVRFVAEKTHPKHIGKEKRQELTKGQSPFAIVLTCADSRVAPELVFDQGLGDLFVLRVAGNISGPFVLGSIEYAVEHLHNPLCIVLGHENCDAVAAALSKEPFPGNLGKLIKEVHVGKDLPKNKEQAL